MHKHEFNFSFFFSFLDRKKNKYYYLLMDIVIASDEETNEPKWNDVKELTKKSIDKMS